MLRMEMFGAHNVFQLIFNEARRLFHSIVCLFSMCVCVWAHPLIISVCLRFFLLLGKNNAIHFLSAPYSFLTFG